MVQFRYHVVVFVVGIVVVRAVLQLLLLQCRHCLVIVRLQRPRRVDAEHHPHERNHGLLRRLLGVEVGHVAPHGKMLRDAALGGAGTNPTQCLAQDGRTRDEQQVLAPEHGCQHVEQKSHVVHDIGKEPKFLHVRVKFVTARVAVEQSAHHGDAVATGPREGGGQRRGLCVSDSGGLQDRGRTENAPEVAAESLQTVVELVLEVSVLDGGGVAGGQKQIREDLLEGGGCRLVPATLVAFYGLDLECCRRG